MPRPATKPITMSVELDRSDYERLFKIYNLLGKNLLDELTAELQNELNRMVKSKIKVLEEFINPTKID